MQKKCKCIGIRDKTIFTLLRLESAKNSNDNDKLQQQIGTHDTRLTELNFNRRRVGSHFYLASGIKLN